jgi:hypothetical protein
LRPLHGRADSAKPTIRLAAGIGLATACALALVLLYQALFRAWVVNSDQANVLLASTDMASGNWRLRGWVLPSDNFWGLEVALTALVGALSHDSLLTLRLVPAIAWAAMGAATCWLAWTPQRPWGALSVVAAMVLIPPLGQNIDSYYARSPLHVLSVACIAVAICLVRRALAEPAKAGRVLLVYALLMANASASDPLFTVLGIGPILAALCFAAIPPNSGRASLIVITISAALAGKAIILVNEVTGGFIAAPAHTHFVTYQDIPNSIAIFIYAILNSVGCNPFGMDVSDAIPRLVRLPLLVLVTVAVWRCACQLQAGWRARWRGHVGSPRLPDFTDTALLFVVAGTSAAMLLSETVTSLISVRYFLPAWIAGTALLARRGGGRFGIAAYCLVIAATTLAADLRIAVARGRPQVAETDRNLVSTLAAEGLDHGFGTYWLASVTNVLSGNAISIRALAVNDSGKLVPHVWLCDRNWYGARAEPAGFFVVTQVNDTMVPPSAIVRTFGAPSRTLTLGDIVIDVYDGPAPVWKLLD